jgi:hypothetical protein
VWRRGAFFVVRTRCSTQSEAESVRPSRAMHSHTLLDQPYRSMRLALLTLRETHSQLLAGRIRSNTRSKVRRATFRLHGSFEHLLRLADCAPSRRLLANDQHNPFGSTNWQVQLETNGAFAFHEHPNLKRSAEARRWRRSDDFQILIHYLRFDMVKIVKV